MEDGRIVQLYWDRDEKAIPATAEKYGRYCTSIAKNILGNLQEAEECVNDTYLNAWNAMPPHRPGMLSAFLGKITRNLSWNRYKHNTADKRGGGQMPLILEELGDCVKSGQDVEMEIEKQELVQTINAFLKKLSVETRQQFVQRYWYGKTIPEIALYFNQKESTVAMRLSRTRKKLYRYLLERGYEA